MMLDTATEAVESDLNTLDIDDTVFETKLRLLEPIRQSSCHCLV